jgi:hypothetical protein
MPSFFYASAPPTLLVLRSDGWQSSQVMAGFEDMTVNYATAAECALVLSPPFFSDTLGGVPAGIVIRLLSDG